MAIVGALLGTSSIKVEQIFSEIKESHNGGANEVDHSSLIMFRCLPARRSINSHGLPNKPFSITSRIGQWHFRFLRTASRSSTFHANRLLNGAWVSAKNRKLDHQHLAPLKSLEF